MWQTPDALWEIGVDVLPASQGQGWGRVTVSTATAWILARAPVAYYTTGEPDDGSHTHYGLAITVWPGEERTILAHADFHGAWLEWLG